MADFTIEFWYWWVAAAGLVVLEIFAPASSSSGWPSQPASSA